MLANSWPIGSNPRCRKMCRVFLSERLTVYDKKNLQDNFFPSFFQIGRLKSALKYSVLNNNIVI